MNESGHMTSIFVDQEIVQNFLCSLCDCVVKKAVITAEGCEFCQDCILAELTKAKASNHKLRCPKCMNEFIFKAYPNKRTRDAVNLLETKCPNFNCLIPCLWTGTVSDYDEHVMNCPLTEVVCEFYQVNCCIESCTGKVLRRDLATHNVPSTHVLRKIQELTADLNTQRTMSQAQSDAIQQLTAEKVEKSTQITSLQVQLQQVITEKKALTCQVCALSQEKSGWTSQQDTLEIKIEALMTENAALTAEKVKNERQLETALAKVTQLTAEKVEWSVQKEFLQAEVRQLTIALRTVCGLKSRAPDDTESRNKAAAPAATHLLAITNGEKMRPQTIPAETATYNQTEHASYSLLLAMATMSEEDEVSQQGTETDDIHSTVSGMSADSLSSTSTSSSTTSKTAKKPRVVWTKEMVCALLIVILLCFCRK